MDEEKKKRLIIFTSQSFKQKGIRATRMDAIAHGLNISKRTIYEVYKTKDNLIGACLVSYSERTKNLFRIIECGSQCPLPRLLGTSKAFVENLYKGENAFWHDVTSHYGYIYDAIREIWYAELARRVSDCQTEGLVMPGLDVDCFLGTFTAGKKDIRIENGRLNIVQDGPHIKFKKDVDHITFSGRYSLEKGTQKVFYITERAVFTLTEQGLTLIETAPGIDIEKDIFAKMEFRPVISPELKAMDERLFRPELMKLTLKK